MRSRLDMVKNLYLPSPKYLFTRKLPDTLFFTTFTNQYLIILFTEDLSIKTLKYNFLCVFCMNNTVRAFIVHGSGFF